MYFQYLVAKDWRFIHFIDWVVSVFNNTSSQFKIIQVLCLLHGVKLSSFIKVSERRISMTLGSDYHHPLARALISLGTAITEPRYSRHSYQPTPAPANINNVNLGHNSRGCPRPWIHPSELSLVSPETFITEDQEELDSCFQTLRITFASWEYNLHFPTSIWRIKSVLF